MNRQGQGQDPLLVHSLIRSRVLLKMAGVELWGSTRRSFFEGLPLLQIPIPVPGAGAEGGEAQAAHLAPGPPGVHRTSQPLAKPLGGVAYVPKPIPGMGLAQDLIEGLLEFGG
jgi:hypothetical protein